jgi:pyrroloquinoline quinone biosynthesis protein E
MEPVTIKKYMSYLGNHKYPALFSDEVIKRLKNIEEVYGDVETEETILEVVMNSPEKECDYSIKLLTYKDTVKDYWYELDYNAYKSTDIASCYFIDASSLKPGQDNSNFYQNILPQLAGGERAENLMPMLKKCVNLLEGKNKTVFQLGAMTARGENDSLRFFTYEMTKEELLSYLEAMNWKGSLKAVEELLCQLQPCCAPKGFILDFDITAEGISEKIGICFGTKDKRYRTVEKTIDYLTENGLCISEKRDDIVRWNTCYPNGNPFIQNDISHFKFAFKGENILAAKAYLRQSTKMRTFEFRAYDAPVLMNLELTTRCPLHCPQCYCDLNTGKDMPLEEALYWLEEAARNNVYNVNLSGGETTCYPHLAQLIKKCHELGLKSNIALSGCGVTKESLKEWIDAGVHGIFISLNGSTEEINAKTRDGFKLAVNAIKLLKETDFDYTCINWVMHGCNADDFPNMIKMAEEYGIKHIAVMVFKPDASHQLPNLPTKEQMQTVAKIIKNYKGRVKIEAEECFSQMRAMTGERFFINLNTGISRGCGAGRDGISINVDGKITPCRHLEFPEKARSIRDYWYNSPILKELRSLEDKMESPCRECRYKNNCLPCAAVNVKLRGRIEMGTKECVVPE